ncbi:dTDP-4-dehydrorhamnose reductase [Anaerobacillus alkalidiazotrophicus]|uniref:dTDP-4-dehydrorhamnose reductase n=1 Tax=Anaerobacillus alkalidiazotrophicus TaxID=472963 RepID=A0A1S2M4P3_9BACI|nr:dTDP-4-dehydrorhamnose reductase [Anaerobacillus alkalidiazotrophicus]OIJ18605.1 dTDP-4-dehydrorhamnose reductase [Anaerobacillus alkalidiazotrophicus]
MRILITGANGQLGKELAEKAKQLATVTALGKDQLDITNQIHVSQVINSLKPDVIIHAAAYTAVDQCEHDKMKAFEVNSLGTLHVAKEAKQSGAKMVYISSDYVFSGDKTTPYREEDHPNPKSVYGLSKWLGEQLVRSIIEESYIVRTSWLYGSSGKNFVKTMLKLAEQRNEVKVVDDQIGSPTYTKDLADVIMQLIGKTYGIYHVSNSGFCSWYMFAKYIFKEAGFDPNLIKPITTEAYGALAPRPAYSVLAHNSLKREEIEKPRRWEEAVDEFIREELKHD